MLRLLIFLACIGLLYWLWLQLERPNLGALPFRRKDYLLTRAERAFFDVLLQACNGDCYIFSKTRLADLVWLPRGTPHRQALLNRVLSKHIDFVLCDRLQLRPLLAIELDDSSHAAPGRIARDEVVRRILEAAGLPLLRVPVSRDYSVSEVAALIVEAQLPGKATPEAGRSEPVSRT